MSDEASITVVIATLGGHSLAATIQSVNSGAIRPAEILVCIPAENASRVAHLQGGNTRIVKTDFRGQVAQRLLGFRTASFDLVMQLDDDILVGHYCLARLVQTLWSAKEQKVAVAPAFIDQATGTSVYKKPKKSRVLLWAYYWFMNGSKGYAPGCIDKSGSAVGIDPAASEKILHDVEWLAGGCVLHHRENLVLENFWLRGGKAYCEDIVHSHILRSKGIRLIVDTSARCSLALFDESGWSLKEFATNLYRDYCGRRYYMRRLSRSSPRIYLYYFARILSYIRSRL